MSLDLHLIGDYDTDESFERVSKVLHSRFDEWPARVVVTLSRSPKGWIIARATATILDAAGEGKAETSKLVAQEVRALLEEVGELVA